MKIESFKKKRDNRYDVKFDNGTVVAIYDDVIVRFNLLSHKNLTDKEFEEVTTFNDELEAYYKALKYLSSKLRSPKEIKTYLKKAKYKAKTITKTIDQLTKDGYSNDLVYITAYLNDQLRLTNNGPHKILKSLIQLGYKEEIIQHHLNEIPTDVWCEKLDKVLTKKIKLNHTLGSQRLKEKLIFDLVNLGYDKQLVADKLDGLSLEDDMKQLKKEANKLLIKYQTKYPKDKLEYQLRNKLYLKGYTLDAINSILDEII